MRRFLASILIFIGLALPCAAAVGLDAATCTPVFVSGTSGTASADNTVTSSGEALVLVVVQSDGGSAITGLTAHWDPGTTNQAFTFTQSATNGSQSVWLLGLRNATVGNLNLSLSWTNTAQLVVCGQAFTGVDLTSDVTAFKNFNSATNGTPDSVNITSPSGNYTIAGFSSSANFTSTNGTQIFQVNTGTTWATSGNVAAGSGTTTMTGNPGSGSSLAAGISLGATGGGGGSTPTPELTMMGVGP